MIRRDWPLGADQPQRWVLIPQTEHARLSGELARAWGSGAAPPIVCPADEPGHPLAGVRDEFLAAALHHDDGWLGWSDAPAIDPEHGRPVGFTEMPPPEAQRIWSESIDACRAIGPLAGWVVAAHFSALQSKRDDDYHLWVDWLAEVDARREGWLAEWLGSSEHHTPGLADRCLAWLQSLDWISLWLCCVCPVLPKDAAPHKPLLVGGDQTGWPEVAFTPQGDTIRVSPWPFAAAGLTLSVAARSVPAQPTRPGEPADEQPAPITWRLAAG